MAKEIFNISMSLIAAGLLLRLLLHVKPELVRSRVSSRLMRLRVEGHCAAHDVARSLLQLLIEYIVALHKRLTILQ